MPDTTLPPHSPALAPLGGRRPLPVPAETFVLPAAGLLFCVGFLLRGPLPTTPSQVAAASAAPAYETAWLVLVLASVGSLWGVLALYRHFSSGPFERSAFLAAVLCSGAWAVEAALQGVFALLGRTVGHPEVASAVLSLPAAGPNFLVLFALEGLLGLAGGVLFGIVIWRSRALPRWTALPFALHLVLLNNAGGSRSSRRLRGRRASWSPAGRSPGASGQGANGRLRWWITRVAGSGDRSAKRSGGDIGDRLEHDARARNWRYANRFGDSPRRQGSGGAPSASAPSRASSEQEVASRGGSSVHHA